MPNECEGHESLAGAHMGESVYCDGSCVVADDDDEDTYDGPPHEGHRSRLSGIWWCDTCNSRYCDLA